MVPKNLVPALVILAIGIFGISLATEPRSKEEILQIAQEMCSEENSTQYRPTEGFLCCNKTPIELTDFSKPGFWREFQLPTGSNDNLTANAWYMYSQYISKLQGGNKTITILKFANLIMAKYPESVKASIIKSLEQSSGAEESSKWSSSEISLTDYEELNRIRIAYYNSESQVCGGNSSLSKSEIDKASIWSGCAERNQYDQHDHSLQYCCKGTTLPFNYHGPEWSDYRAVVQSCNKNMGNAIVAKMNLTRPEDLHYLTSMCTPACDLLYEKTIRAEDVLNFNGSLSITTVDSVVAAMSPNYLPKEVSEFILTDVKANLKNKSSILVHQDMKSFHMKTNVSGAAAIGCFVYRELWLAALESLYKYCHEEMHNSLGQIDVKTTKSTE